MELGLCQNHRDWILERLFHPYFCRFLIQPGSHLACIRVARAPVVEICALKPCSVDQDQIWLWLRACLRIHGRSGFGPLTTSRVTLKHQKIRSRNLAHEMEVRNCDHETIRRLEPVE